MNGRQLAMPFDARCGETEAPRHSLAAMHSAAQRMPGVSKAEIENTLVAAAFLRRASEQLADAVRRLEFLAMAAWAEPPCDATAEVED